VFGSTPHIAQDQTTVAGELAVDMTLDMLVVVENLLLVGAVVTHPAARITADELRRWLNLSGGRSTWAVPGGMDFGCAIDHPQTAIRANVLSGGMRLSVLLHDIDVGRNTLVLLTTARVSTNKRLGDLDRLHSSLVHVDSVLNETHLYMLLTIVTPRELKVAGATCESSVDVLSLMLV